MNSAPLAEAQRAAIARLEQLAPSHRNPEHYHSEKSDILASLRGVADFLEGNWQVNPPVPDLAGPTRTEFPAGERRDKAGNVVCMVEWRRRRSVQTK